MNEQIKAKWIDALGSGEYQQAKGCLREIDGGFCCLGVLSDLHVKEGAAQWKQLGGTYEYLDEGARIGEISVLPKAVQEWSGLFNVIGMLSISIEDRNNKLYTSLTQLNDDGFTFEQISDFIKAFI